MWVPADEAELTTALASGGLVESHTADFKKELGSGVSANANLAVDIASLAVDGGALFIGVDEASTPPAVTPFQLKGVKERIDQIALSRIDPPIRVTIREIDSAKPGEGTLVVIVSPTPEAPHMVDGKYRGRGDTTNRALADAEVRRIRDERARALEALEAGLDRELRRDPLGTGRPEARMLVLARPSYAPAEVLLPLVQPNYRASVSQIFLSGAPGDPGELLQPSWSPDFLGGLNIVRRPDGWAITTAALGGSDRGELDLEIPRTESSTCSPQSLSTVRTTVYLSTRPLLASSSAPCSPRERWHASPTTWVHGTSA